FQLIFAPTATGPQVANVLVSAPGVGSASTPLAGNGVSTAPLLTITPASQDFGAVTTGDASSQPRNFTVTNVSMFPATSVATFIAAGTGPDPDPSDFVVVSACPTPLAAGATCTVSVLYVPDAVGAVTSTAALNVQAANNGAIVTASSQLSGTRLTDA